MVAGAVAWALFVVSSTVPVSFPTLAPGSSQLASFGEGAPGNQSMGGNNLFAQGWITLDQCSPLVLQGQLPSPPPLSSFQMIRPTTSPSYGFSFVNPVSNPSVKVYRVNYQTGQKLLLLDLASSDGPLTSTNIDSNPTDLFPVPCGGSLIVADFSGATYCAWIQNPVQCTLQDSDGVHTGSGADGEMTAGDGLQGLNGDGFEGDEGESVGCGTLRGTMNRSPEMLFFFVFLLGLATLRFRQIQNRK